ncbi:hypothetical protein LWI28_007777 [Acer negundo]|uniref:Uncharacterized protein n=1 Tax=Acer negundo TaxID=4023 RepID=A0AAD5NJV1_ACENE|nr:hypothetical protein LWI28_007777 [Acer negundo]
MRIDVFTKERDEVLKVGKELTKLVESQEEEFNRRTRKVLIEMERKDKKCQALEEDLVVSKLKFVLVAQVDSDLKLVLVTHLKLVLVA